MFRYNIIFKYFIFENVNYFLLKEVFRDYGFLILLFGEKSK